MMFYGRGWGHGVGMCQVGAYGMALDGATFEEILTKYYKGIELKKLYERAPYALASCAAASTARAWHGGTPPPVHGAAAGIPPGASTGESTDACC